MSRLLSSEAEAALQEPGYDARAYLVRIVVPSGVALMTTHVRNVDYNGETYLAVGNLGSISNITESNTLQASGVKLTLSGLDATLRTLVQTELYQGGEVKVYLQFLDANDDPDGDPMLFWEGFLDTADVVTGGGLLAIEAACEAFMTEWEQPRRLTYSDEDQRELHSTDRFFEYVPQLSTMQVKWGGAVIDGTARGGFSGGAGNTDTMTRPRLP